MRRSIVTGSYGQPGSPSTIGETRFPLSSLTGEPFFFAILSPSPPLSRSNPSSRGSGHSSFLPGDLPRSFGGMAKQFSCIGKCFSQPGCEQRIMYCPLFRRLKLFFEASSGFSKIHSVAMDQIRTCSARLTYENYAAPISNLSGYPGQVMDEPGHHISRSGQNYNCFRNCRAAILAAILRNSAAKIAALQKFMKYAA